MSGSCRRRVRSTASSGCSAELGRASLTAYEQAYGPIDVKHNIGNLFWALLGNDKVVGPKIVGSLHRRLRHGSGLKTKQAKLYECA